MSVLEQILQDIQSYETDMEEAGISCLCPAWVKEIIKKHLSAEDMNDSANDDWIPVEKDLPEQKPKDVIMCYPEGERKETHTVSDVVQVTVYNTKDGNYLVAEDSLYEGVWALYGDVLSIYKVIAWKPLPEPYKPEKLV